MRIGFDGRSLASPAGGVRRYAGELLDELVRVSPSDTIVVFGASAESPRPDGVQNWAVRQIFPTNSRLSLVDLPRAIAHERLDVFHAPAYTAPLGGIVHAGTHDSRRKLRAAPRMVPISTRRDQTLF
jgi:hypothetical protein